MVDTQVASGSMKHTQIAAVLVTFNRCGLLLECLQGLLRQTRPVDRIFVVDNCSTDNTLDCLRDLAERHPVIKYRSLDRNTGGAGGFAHAMQWAYDEGYDWLWVMDDDVEPYPQGLENLLPYADRSRCIHGLRTEPDGQVFAWGSHFEEVFVDTVPMPSQLPEEHGAAIEMNVACFEGMLVHRDVIAQAGLPWADLFITWDDTYFGYCASKVTKVLYVRVLSLKRKRAMDRISAGFLGSKWSMTAMGNYYHHRNRYMLATRLKPVAWKFWMRNGWVYLKAMAKELLLRHHWANAKSIHRGTVDGLEYYWRKQ